MATFMNANLANAEEVDADSARPRAGFFARVLAAMIEARERAAEREIERYIANHGGVLTDSIERDLSRQFGNPAGVR